VLSLYSYYILLICHQIAIIIIDIIDINDNNNIEIKLI
jgi:hypothetical protein